MADISTTTMAPETLRNRFAERAAAPTREISQAEKFISTVSKFASNGAAAAPRKEGERLLQTLEERTEVFLFNAAILAGQETEDDAALEARLAEIDKNVEMAQRTSSRLRDALSAMA